MGAYSIANSPNVTTDTDWTPQVWDLEIRRATQGLFAFRQFAKDVRSTWGDSDSVGVIKRNNIATAGAALTAGTTMPRNTFTTGTVVYTPAEYGNAISPEARLLRLSPFGMSDELRDVLARDAASVIDTAVRTVLVSGLGTAGANSFVMGAGGTAIAGTTVPSGTVGTSVYRVTSNGVWACVDYLAGQNAPRVQRADLGMPSGYVGVLHPFQSRGIKRDSSFVNVSLYGKPGNIFNNEIGFWEGVYWIETTQGYKDTANNNYCAFILGSDVFGEYTVQEITVKRDPDTDFGRQQHWAWYFDAGWSIEYANYYAGLWSITGSPGNT